MMIRSRVESSNQEEKLSEKKEKNREQRREFVKYWAEYIKNHHDKEWSRQQNLLIDSQIEENAKNVGAMKDK